MKPEFLQGFMAACALQKGTLCNFPSYLAPSCRSLRACCSQPAVARSVIAMRALVETRMQARVVLAAEAMAQPAEAPPRVETQSVTGAREPSLHAKMERVSDYGETAIAAWARKSANDAPI